MWHPLPQQVASCPTCAGGYAFAGSINGFLASYSCLLKLAIPTARAVSVAVETTDNGNVTPQIYKFSVY